MRTLYTAASGRKGGFLLPVFFVLSLLSACVQPPYKVDQTSTPPPPPPPPPTTSRPDFSWNDVSLINGNRRAWLDGVTVWMDTPPAMVGGQLTVTPEEKAFFFDPILSPRATPLVQNRPVRVMIDPGHGGSDPGAVRGDPGGQPPLLKESFLTLDIAKRLAALLSQNGYDVQLTRTEDVYISPDARPALARQWKPDLFVSIHVNASPQSVSVASGFETYHMPPANGRTTAVADSNGGPPIPPRAYSGNSNNVENVRLAFAVQRQLLKNLNFADRGVKRARFAVLREVSVPAILVEAGFISNRSDAQILSTPQGREKIAQGIYHGIVDYIVF